MRTLTTLSWTTALIYLNSVLAYRKDSSYSTRSYGPVAFHIGSSSPNGPVGFQPCESGVPYTLDASTPVLSLDYGSEVAGFPYVDVASFDSEYAQVELKYSEPYEGLGLPYGDGPWYASEQSTTTIL